MTWNSIRFPAAMRSLNPSTRAMAIEIANNLINQKGMNKQQAISISILIARKWSADRSPYHHFSHDPNTTPSIALKDGFNFK
ncbi:hypothetical protein [Larkinella sp. C7]|jgi:uncharacterized protein YdaT|uniref:hypothetical protein n=1 Tax=Larkinella sp. C7 TaxID=2576607 RepID=UPI00111138A1|nr:hypothetical protein [Larkinella sp. C7]